MSIERKYSKAKASGNNVVWTGREALLFPTLLPVLSDNKDFGFLRIAGRDMYCRGLRADFGDPAGDAWVSCSVTLFTANDIEIPGSTFNLNGVVAGADMVFNPPVPMPVNSIWKLRVNVSSPTGDVTFFPKNLSVTYQLYYALGPVQASLFVVTDPQRGVGFDQVGATLVVY